MREKHEHPETTYQHENGWEVLTEYHHEGKYTVWLRGRDVFAQSETEDDRLGSQRYDPVPVVQYKVQYNKNSYVRDEE
jgi:hypothetical protein